MEQRIFGGVVKAKQTLSSTGPTALRRVSHPHKLFFNPHLVLGTECMFVILA
jgi:hypothetical protein